jgi:MoaA/NifB/PqqE/SkfB family radical SAM enzyme
MAYQVMPFPTRLHIESTNICNLDCLFCPYGRQQRQKGYMGLDLFQKIIEECKGHDVRLWLHFLGEPLLNRDLPAMVAFAKAHGLPQVGFSTNGFFLTQELGETKIRAGLDRLECSMDGVDPPSYQRLRRSREFHRVVANLQNFLRLRNELGSEQPVVTIQFMKTPETVAFLPQARAFWAPMLKPRDFLMTIEDISFAGEMRGCTITVNDSLQMVVELCGRAVERRCGDMRQRLRRDTGHENVREQSLTAIWHSRVMRSCGTKHFEGGSARGICAGCDDWALSDGYGYQPIEEKRPRL